MSKPRTLLARMGFQDPDRHTAEHDAMTRRIFKDPRAVILDRLGLVASDARVRPSVSVEEPLAKVCFLDAVIRWYGHRSQPEWVPESGYEVITEAGGAPIAPFSVSHYTAVVEVKSGVPDLGDWLRQIRTQKAAWAREYSRVRSLEVLGKGVLARGCPATWVLLTAHPLHADDEAIFEAQGVRVLLDEGAGGK